MKKNSTAGETFCRTFCAYYKPAKKEELACRGFIVAQCLIEKGRITPLSRPETTLSPDDATAESLRRHLCGACDFREGDCDFILTGGKALPCGGYVLLAHLLGTGTIVIDELR